ncbi:hypothetical protein [Streptomyces sp. NPDC093261]|uniref:hypothetical protein n=1 Tax=Streptomyces sp. NPDC093261 TaxID=3366037 RepID=UPI0037FC0F1A
MRGGARTSYPQPARARVPWSGRQEDKVDDGVRAVACFLTRTGYRRRGITYALARATVGRARDRGARASEAYPVITCPGLEITWGRRTSAAARCSPRPASGR